MRFANIIVPALAIVSLAGGTTAAVEAPSGIRGGESGLTSTAWYWGNLQAKNKWDPNIYSCTLKDVLLEFWPDVSMDIIKTDCVNQYPYSPTYQKACGDGAETYVWKKANECVELSECIDMGFGIADGVIAKYCYRKIPPEKLDLVPQWCETFAILACKFQVIFADYSDYGFCSAPTTVEEFMPLWEDCEDEVTHYLDTAALPGTTGQPAGPGSTTTTTTTGLSTTINACRDCKETCEDRYSIAILSKICKDKCKKEYGDKACSQTSGGTGTTTIGPTATIPRTQYDPVAACKDCKDECRYKYPDYSDLWKRKECTDQCRDEHGRGPCGES